MKGVPKPLPERTDARREGRSAKFNRFDACSKEGCSTIM